MLLPRKYFTLYVVIGSILVFSLKDSLNLVHTLLHTLPNPLHSHAFALPHPPMAHGEHDERVPHTHPISHSQPDHSDRKVIPYTHDVMDHLAYDNQKKQVGSPASPIEKQASKQSASEIWDIQAFFSYQLIPTCSVQRNHAWFTAPRMPFPPSYPPSPPPELV